MFCKLSADSLDVGIKNIVHEHHRMGIAHGYGCHTKILIRRRQKVAVDGVLRIVFRLYGLSGLKWNVGRLEYGWRHDCFDVFGDC